MEIIDKFSRTLGLSEKDREKETQMETQEGLQEEQLEQKETPIQPPPVDVIGRNVVDFNSARAARDNLMTNNIPTKSEIKTKITTVRPKSFDEDAKIIADCLREDIPVIVNLEETSPEHARRIIDFALGTTYAIDGEVQQVSEYVFVCTPKTAMVTFNREEIRQERDFSWLTKKL